MAKSTVIVEGDVWTLLSNGKCVITVNNTGTEPLFINEASSDTDATQYFPGKSDWFSQNEVKPTYAKSESRWELIVDEEG